MSMIEKALKVDGMYWPKADRQCRAAVIGSEVEMQPALDLIQRERMQVAVQAGGNVGIWPIWLSERFEKVFTFEPDPLNFWCLSNNLSDRMNVSRWNAALGEKLGMVGMKTDPRNVGAHSIDGSGDIPVLTIDRMNLMACDFLCLDIEGYELLALKGAAETIKRFHPVIQIEDKGLSVPYGIQKGDAEKWLSDQFGYEVRHRIKRDVILS